MSEQQLCGYRRIAIKDGRTTEEQPKGYLRTLEEIRLLLGEIRISNEAKDRLNKELKLEVTHLRKEQCRLRRNLLVLDELKGRLERTGLIPGWLKAKMEGTKR